MSALLPSPTKTAWRDSELISLNAPSGATAPHSTWFHTYKIPTTNKESWLKISSQYATSSWPATTAGEPPPFVEVDKHGELHPSNTMHRKKQAKGRGKKRRVTATTTTKNKKGKVSTFLKTRKLSVRVRSAADAKVIRKYIGVVRWIYNQCIAMARRLRRVPSLQELRNALVKKISPAVVANPWLGEVGFDIRDDGVSAFLDAMRSNETKLRQGDIRKFRMAFRKKKYLQRETITIRPRWLKRTPRGLELNLPNSAVEVRKQVRLRNGERAIKSATKRKTLQLHISKRDRQWCHSLFALQPPREPKEGETVAKVVQYDHVEMLPATCKLQLTRSGKVYLCVPHSYEVPAASSRASMRVCALDPGVRTFQTIFDANTGDATQVADGDIRRVFRLCKHLDKLYSKIALERKSKRRCNLRRAARRLVERIQHLVREVHCQTAKHIASRYDLVMIPKFETSQMIRRLHRKIGKVTARMLARWSHYAFRQRLLFKCAQLGCRVAVVDEAYTSKTCSTCGVLNFTLGSKKVFKCKHCKTHIDRDVNGAKNIFLKNYEALLLEVKAEEGGCVLGA